MTRDAGNFDVRLSGGAQSDDLSPFDAPKRVGGGQNECFTAENPVFSRLIEGLRRRGIIAETSR